MNSFDIAAALLRTTLATAVAAVFAAGLLAALRVSSPRVHRAAWALVVAQGWLLIPWTLRIESVEEAAPVESLAAVTEIDPRMIESAEPFPVVDDARLQSPPRIWNVGRLAMLAWLAGAAGLAFAGAVAYLRVSRSLPRGSKPDRADWQAEWQSQVRRANIRQRVELRMTAGAGPLLCWIPFTYLVLAPRNLWTALAAPQRSAILRHELAHLQRRDLWKSLAIRLLALPQWFNPAAWLAVRRFDEAGEWACDELAASEAADGRLAFANSLLQAAELVTAPASGSLGFLGQRRRRTLTQRIKRLVTPRFREESNMKKLTVPALLVALATLQSMRVERVAAGDQNPPPSKGGARGGIPDAPTSPQPAPRPSTSVPEQNIPPANVRPYVIEPPDILSVEFSAKISGRGVQSDAEVKTILETQPKQHVVAMDGRINLGTYGAVYVAGMTIDQARQAIEKLLARHEAFQGVKAKVDVLASKSKVYYIIAQEANGSDGVTRCPITGNDTVLDAVAAIGGISRETDCNMWIARPAPEGVGEEQILPVNWTEIATGTSTSTNYQLQGGDRLFIKPSRHVSKPPAPVKLRRIGHRLWAPVKPTPASAVVGESTKSDATVAADGVVIDAESTLRDATAYYLQNAAADGMILDAEGQVIEVEGLKAWLDAAMPNLPVAPSAAASDQPADAETQSPEPDATIAADRIQFFADGKVKIEAARPVAGPNPPQSAAEERVDHQLVCYDVMIIEDPQGSLAEFESLREEGDALVADAKTVLAAVRILERNKLVGIVSRPRLMVALGRPGALSVGGRAKENGKEVWQGLKLTLSADRRDGKLAVTIDMEKADHGGRFEVQANRIEVEEGQVIMVRTRGTRVDADAPDPSPTYLFVTPSIPDPATLKRKDILYYGAPPSERPDRN